MWQRKFCLVQFKREKKPPEPKEKRLCFFIAEFSCKALYGQQKLGISFYNNFCSHHYFSTKSSVILGKQKFVKICQVYQEKECLFHFFSTKFSVILHRHPASKLKYILHKPYNKTVNSIRVQTTHTPFGLMSCFFPSQNESRARSRSLEVQKKNNRV